MIKFEYFEINYVKNMKTKKYVSYYFNHFNKKMNLTTKTRFFFIT